MNQVNEKLQDFADTEEHMATALQANGIDSDSGAPLAPPK